MSEFKLFIYFYHVVLPNQLKCISRLICDQTKISKKTLVDPPNLGFDNWIIHLRI